MVAFEAGDSVRGVSNNCLVRSIVGASSDAPFVWDLEWQELAEQVFDSIISEIDLCIGTMGSEDSSISFTVAAAIELRHDLTSADHSVCPIGLGRMLSSPYFDFRILVLTVIWKGSCSYWTGSLLGSSAASDTRVIICFDGHARPVVSGLWSLQSDWVDEAISEGIIFDLTGPGWRDDVHTDFNNGRRFPISMMEYCRSRDCSRSRVCVPSFVRIDLGLSYLVPQTVEISKQPPSRRSFFSFKQEGPTIPLMAEIAAAFDRSHLPETSASGTDVSSTYVNDTNGSTHPPSAETPLSTTDPGSNSEINLSIACE